MEPLFSGDEMFGKYFDLTTLHQTFKNLSDNHTQSYRDYMSTCDDFILVPLSVRQSAVFFNYLTALKSYFESFFQKSLPLFDFLSLKTRLLNQFYKEWLDGKYEMNKQSETWCAACNKVS